MFFAVRKYMFLHPSLTFYLSVLCYYSCSLYLSSPTEVPCYILNLIFKDTPIRRAWWRRQFRSSWTKGHFTTCWLRDEWTHKTCGKADKGFRDEVSSTLVRVGYKLYQLGGQHCKGVTWSCYGTLLGVANKSFYHLKAIITESSPWVKLVLRNLLCISDNTCTIWGHLRPRVHLR